MFPSDWHLFWYEHRHHPQLERWELISTSSEIVDIRPLVAQKLLASTQELGKAFSNLGRIAINSTLSTSRLANQLKRFQR